MLAVSPFISAYAQADFFGKVIFLAIFALSVVSWIVMIHKLRMARAVEKTSHEFEKLFSSRRHDPLSIEVTRPDKEEFSNPFRELYSVLRQQTMEVLGKNQQVQGKAVLSSADIHLVEAHLMSMVSSQSRYLGKNLYILSTVVSLAPFLGLLGTVWGSLITLSELTMQASGANQMVLSGLSMALGTTVVGLVVAIPALIGHNALRQKISDCTDEMENFCSEMLAAVELNYRTVDVG